MLSAWPPPVPRANWCRSSSTASIASVGIYDPTYPMPHTIRFREASSLGLMAGNPTFSTVWEDANRHDTAATNNPGNNVWAFGAWNLLGNASAYRIDYNRSRVLSGETRRYCALYIAMGPAIDTRSHWFPGNSSGNSTDNSRNGRVFAALLAMMKAVPETPVVLLGIGAGRMDRCNGTLNIGRQPSLQWQFLHEFQRRIDTYGGFMGLRGKCSESTVLQSLGTRYARNIKALGCPSLFINTNPDLGYTLQLKYKKILQKLQDGDPLKVAIMLGNREKVSYARPLVRFFLAHRKGSIHVMQQHAEQQLFNKFVRMLSSDEQVRQDAANVTFFFTDVFLWRQKLMNVDLAIGPRIHGAMIALAAGTPAVTIVPESDIRMIEFCEKMHLAHIIIKESLLHEDKGDNIIDTVKRGASTFNGSAFDANRKVLAAEYVRLFRTAGLWLNPKVAALAKPGQIAFKTL